MTRHTGCIGDSCPLCERLTRPGWEAVRANLAPGPTPADFRCAHLGEPTGETVPCPTCPNDTKNVRQIPLLACAVHGTTTGKRGAPGRRSCFGCPDRAPGAAQIVVTADGIGDHLQGLTVAAAWKQANPGAQLVFVARPAQRPWVRLFGGYDQLEAREVPGLPHAWRAGNDPGRPHFVEAAARAPRAVPPLNPLPPADVAWAEAYRGRVVLAPRTLTACREWLPSHWLLLERQLQAAGRECVIITAGDQPVSGYAGEVLAGLPPSRVAALLLAAGQVVANESGMAHLAGALGVPCVVLAAQLDARAVHGCWPRTKVIMGPLSCSGCRWTGPDWRPACDSLCASLQAITPERVAEALLGGPGWQAILARLDAPGPSWAGGVRADRRKTFGAFLEALEGREKPLIVETGCQRQADDPGAGMSTVLLGRWLAEHGGTLYSIDTNPANVATAESLTAGLPVHVLVASGAAWLGARSEAKIDGLYLDSADVGTPGFEQCCLAEIQAALPRLAPGAVILIDDTIRDGDGWRGKGALAAPWLLSQGWCVRAEGYQVLLGKMP